MVLANHFEVTLWMSQGVLFTGEVFDCYGEPIADWSPSGHPMGARTLEDQLSAPRFLEAEWPVRASWQNDYHMNGLSHFIMLSLEGFLQTNLRRRRALRGNLAHNAEPAQAEELLRNLMPQCSDGLRHLYRLLNCRRSNVCALPRFLIT